MRKSDYDKLTVVLAEAYERAGEQDSPGVDLTASTLVDALKDNDPWLDRARFWRQVDRNRKILRECPF